MRRPPDLPSRSATVLLAVPLALAIVWWAPGGAFVGCVAALAGAAAWQAAGLFGVGRSELRLAAALGGAAMPLLAAVQLPPVPGTRLRIALIAVILVAAWAARWAARRAATTPRLPPRYYPVAWLAAVLYPAVSLATLVPLRLDAAGWIMLALAVCWGGDIGGYVVGATIGRRPLAARVSPNKTVEGAIGSVVLSLVLAWGVGLWALPHEPRSMVMALALAANFAAQAGDLFESSLKRMRGVKDRWWLDTVDGLAFAAPLLYLGRGHWVVS